ncbi:hypothetical protein BX666DRAFT_1667468 [Dichotomocladium elegans]|nr:hypothetical protein BX666DRAFT_1667468 [Dichotomocladium elegans]
MTLSSGFSPRCDPAIFVHQLESIPLSHVRNEPISCKDRRLHLISSFQDVRVAAPVPSKRFRHRIELQQQQQQQASPCSSPSSLPTEPQKQAQKHSPATSYKPSKLSTAVEESDDESTPAAAHHYRRGPEYAYPRESLKVQLRLDPPIKDDGALAFEGDKAKEKEYWRRQRRVFLRSRFITNEEAIAIAHSVYTTSAIAPSDRMVITFQANIANFRSKWRKLLKEVAKKLSHITHAQITEAEYSGPVEQEIQSKV